MSNFSTPDELRRADIITELHKTWRPSPWQLKAGTALFRDKKKKLFFACGRKAGKSELVLYALIRTALEKPGAQAYYCAPYLVQAKELISANNRLQNFVPKKFFVKFNKSELRLIFTNGSFIKLAGADNPDSLRGIEPDILCLDELANITEEFVTAMLPNLKVKDAPVIFCGTPPIMDGVYNKLAEECKNDPTAFWINAKTTDNPHIDPADIEREKQILYARGEHDVFAREYLGQFVRGGSRSIFPMLSKVDHVMPYSVMRERVERDLKHLEFFVVLDPGNSTCFGGLIAAHNPHTQENWIFDEVYETRSTHTSISIIMAKIKGLQQDLFLPPSIDWRWVADEAAKWAMVEIQERDPKIFVEATRKMERSKDAGLSLLKDLLLAKKWNISDRCKNLYSEMENYVTKTDGSIVKARDHLIDCSRYFLGSAGVALGPDVKENTRAIDLDNEDEDVHFQGAPERTDRQTYGFEEDD